MAIQGSDGSVEGPIASSQVRVPIGPITKLKLSVSKNNLMLLSKLPMRRSKGSWLLGMLIKIQASSWIAFKSRMCKIEDEVLEA